ncbi:MAG: divergent polysaccharide deacetylase family protein, partial [Kiloniellales bacterium]
QPEPPSAAVPRSFPYTPRATGPSEGWEDLLAQLEQDPVPNAAMPAARPASTPDAAPLPEARAQGQATITAQIVAPRARAVQRAPQSTDLEATSSEIPAAGRPNGSPPATETLAALPSLPEPDLDGSLPAPDLRGALPPWQRYAVKVAGVPGRPMLAVVIDDVGLNRPGARRAFKLPAPLTMALMSYAEHLPALAAEAKAAGHELLVHLPMEPDDLGNDPGPQALLLDLPPDEQARRVAWALDRFEGFVGINNHMGSRFTADGEAMGRVIAALRARGLLFLDSRTAPDSKGATLAERAGVPFAERDIFIDNQYEDRASIRHQLEAAERIARSRGFAVAIGHPHATTLEVLERWLPEAQKRGIQLVPISAIVRLRLDLALQPVAKAG